MLRMGHAVVCHHDSDSHAVSQELPKQLTLCLNTAVALRALWKNIFSVLGRAMTVFMCLQCFILGHAYIS